MKFPLFPLLGLSSVSMDIISSILSESFKNISSIKRCNCPDGVRRGTKSKYCLVVSRLGETLGTYQDYQVYQDSGWKKYFWNCPQLVVCSQTSSSGHSGLPWVVNFAWLHSSCLRHEVWMLKRDKGKVSLRKWRKWSGVFLLATLENKQLV